MSGRRLISIAICVLLAFALSGAFKMIACECHADTCAPNDFGCVCVCTRGSPAGTAGPAEPAAASAIRIGIIGALHPDDEDLSGRLAESFIFTPPRA
jgi:hypothetical protein